MTKPPLHLLTLRDLVKSYKTTSRSPHILRDRLIRIRVDLPEVQRSLRIYKELSRLTKEIQDAQNFNKYTSIAEFYEEILVNMQFLEEFYLKKIYGKP